MQMRLTNDRLDPLTVGNLTAFMTVGQKVADSIRGIFGKISQLGIGIFEKLGNEF